MKFLSLDFARLRFAILIAALFVVPGAHGITDPTLNLKLAKFNQDLVLSWFGSSAVPYQVETSSNLVTWVSAGPVINGSNSTCFVTNAISDAGAQFYRVDRVFPATNGAAVFDPSTGLLTIIGNESDEVITVLRGGDDIVVNGGMTLITGGVPTVYNTVLIQVLGLGGDDTVTIAGGLPPAHLFGDQGNDTLIGGSGADLFVAGPGNDFVDGNQGSDTIYLGEGDDTVQWDPGDYLDVIEGGEGFDTLQFNGANAGENIGLLAVGSRLHFTRDIASITLDIDGVERVNYRALGGNDTITVHNLAATTVTQVNVDLAGLIGGSDPDTGADAVILPGTAGSDTFNVSTNAGAMEVSGLTTLIRVFHGSTTNDVITINGVSGDVVSINGSPDNDFIALTANGAYARADASGYSCGINVAGAQTLALNALGGHDTISAVGNIAGFGMNIKMDGGDGNDTILGSNANDLLLGGPGNDFLDGNQGSDTAYLGDGEDSFQWDPGDGSDTVEGQGDSDKLVFNGSNTSENMLLSSTGERLRFTRDIGNISMDVNGMERVDVRTLGGFDTVTLSNLLSTVVTQVNLNLTAFDGAGDAAVDTVFVVGTTNAEAFSVSNSAGALEITTSSALVHVSGGELANDRVVINCMGGDAVNINGSSASDTMNFAPSPVAGFLRVSSTGYSLPVDVAGALTLLLDGLSDSDLITGSGDIESLNIPIILDGGDGDDYISGSNAGETIYGGLGYDIVAGNHGNDTVYLGDDDDLFVWNAGDGSDMLEGQNGNDALLINSTTGNDIVNMSASNSRLHVFHNGFNANLDIDGVERVGWQALTGGDNLSIGNLTGTAVQSVYVDLAATAGGTTGDVAQDVITLSGTEAPDNIEISANDGEIDVTGLSPSLHIVQPETNNDGLIVYGLGGNDTFNVGAGVTLLMTVVTNQ